MTPSPSPHQPMPFTASRGLFDKGVWCWGRRGEGEEEERCLWVGFWSGQWRILSLGRLKGGDGGGERLGGISALNGYNL